MDEIYRYYFITNAEQLQDLKDLTGCSALDSAIFARHQPDLHLAIAKQDRLVARCSLWWQNTPAYNNEQLGCIGHYAAESSESAAVLLTQACQSLKERSRTLAIAPIDGNTWRNYRWITESGDRPFFFLEPDFAPDETEQIVQSGFTPFARYYSSLVTDLDRSDKRLERVRDRLNALNITIRCLRLNDWQEELQRIYQIARISFRKNFLYTPLCETEFMAQYSAIKSYVNPELVLLAERGDRPIGFLFAIPDYRQLQDRGNCDTIILKTVGILGDRAYAGLGNILIDRIHHTARNIGYRSVIHALMYSGNSSLNISSRYGQPIRQYSLFAKAL
ncbi:GNAT family N-acetyltransferase [Roseofilum casamattae]|uniref:N-acetyltransferase n=1 Tax=Roseofilum casamattae BLCC-M143 TaxID=3022442 RepID=A0ABT7C2U7_9CYAN|nr:hypothetical protein [Roseofilum casamattae]MDJ1185792.1 N-acetyltransferase [Roseofilum casamattae BLCC-M143]